MALASAELEAITSELVEARRTKQLVPLLTARYADMNVDDAYAVQQRWADHLVADGHRVIGHKIGLTSTVMQQATGITEPDYGVLFEDMVLEGGCELVWSDWAKPRIEVELAFVLDRDLRGPAITVHDVLRATEFVVPALELLESRVELDGRTIVDTISDNAACGAIVLGGQPTRPADLDLRWAGAILYRNHTVEDTGLAAAVLDNPALGVAWLANKISSHGAWLAAGEIVLAGSFTKPAWVNPGDTFHADYGRLGTITCHFA